MAVVPYIALRTLTDSGVTVKPPHPPHPPHPNPDPPWSPMLSRQQVRALRCMRAIPYAAIRRALGQ